MFLGGVGGYNEIYCMKFLNYKHLGKQNKLLDEIYVYIFQ